MEDEYEELKMKMCGVLGQEWDVKEGVECKRQKEGVRVVK